MIGEGSERMANATRNSSRSTVIRQAQGGRLLRLGNQSRLLANDLVGHRIDGTRFDFGVVVGGTTGLTDLDFHNSWGGRWLWFELQLEEGEIRGGISELGTGCSPWVPRPRGTGFQAAFCAETPSPSFAVP